MTPGELVRELVRDYADQGADETYVSSVVTSMSQDLATGCQPEYDAETDQLTGVGAALIREDFARIEWDG